MIFGRYSYVFNLKTTDAELRGAGHLEPSVYNTALPLVELTKSRITSRNPIGSVYRRIRDCRDVLENRQFLLDLTTHDDLLNPEIEDLFDETDGYVRWCRFLDRIEFENVIPMMQVVEGGSEYNIELQARRLLNNFPYLGIRLELSLEEFDWILRPLMRAVGDTSTVVAIIDLGFVPTESGSNQVSQAVTVIDAVRSHLPSAPIVCLASSFPKSVTGPGYAGDEEHDVFELAEVRLTEGLQELYGNDTVYHGDFGLVHPVRYPAGGGWIPRIDVPLEREWFYYRFRRENDGYIAAARAVLDDEYYSSIGAWGDNEIALAADGRPQGRSPMHWIAVRLNLHVTRQVQRVTAGR